MAIPVLKKRGIRTVIDLAGGPDADLERKAVEAAGMKYLLFAIDPMTLDPAPIDPFLKADTPVYDYEPGAWGAKEADRLTPEGGWLNPVVTNHEASPAPAAAHALAAHS